MSSVNEITGVITSDEGWTIKLSRNIVLVNDGDRDIELIVEVLQGGTRLVIYDELERKGFSRKDSGQVLSAVKAALEGVGFSVEIE